METALQQLITAIQNLAPHVYEVYVRQVTVEATSQIIIGLVMFIFGAPGLYCGVYGIKKNIIRDTDSYWYGNVEFVSMLVVLCAVIVLLSISILVYGIMGLSNPEYYAIERFLAHLPR
jgi:hypothetical protein